MKKDLKFAIDSKSFFQIITFLFNIIQLLFISFIYACPASGFVSNGTNILFCLFNICLNKFMKQKNVTEFVSLTCYIIVILILIIMP